MPSHVVWFLAAAFLVGMIATALRIRRDRARRAEMAACAASLEWSFEARGRSLLPDIDHACKILRRGRNGRAYNAMRGVIHDVDAVVFDHHYTTGGSKNKRLHRQTVVALRDASGTLPEFLLRPERIFDKVAAWAGFEDVELPAHPEFSGRFLLRGPDVECLRRIFDDRVVACFNPAEPHWAESRGGWLVTYADRRVVPAADVLDQVERALGMLQHLGRGGMSGRRQSAA